MLGNTKGRRESPAEELLIVGMGGWRNLVGHLPCHLIDHPSVLAGFLNGAEGEGESGQGSSTQGQGQGSGSEGSQSEGEGDGTGTEGESRGEGEGEGSGESGSGNNTPKMYSEEYVKQLRAENAKYRTEKKELESKVSEFEKAQMSELERAQAERKEAAERAEKLEAELRTERISNAIRAAASEKNFHDPEDAVAQIAADKVKIDDDGRPDPKSVKALVNSLAESKPHLVKGTSPGSGDGGAHGGGVQQNERMAAVQKEFEQKGYVKVG